MMGEKGEPELRKLLALGGATVVGVVFAAVAFAFDGGPGVDAEPQFVAGNPTCPAGSTSFVVKVDPPAEGQHNFIQITNLTETTFDWNIHPDFLHVVDADVVIVKGGPNALLYNYGLGADGTDDDFGTGLHAPLNPRNGKFFGLSHITFCFDPKA